MKQKKIITFKGDNLNKRIIHYSVEKAKEQLKKQYGKDYIENTNFYVVHEKKLSNLKVGESI